jgi:chaperonin GroES
MILEPLNKRVAIKRSDKEDMTSTGIIIPGTAKEAPAQGVVVAVSEDKETEVLIDVGDKVYFGKYAGIEVEVDGEEFVILDKIDILFKVKGK